MIKNTEEQAMIDKIGNVLGGMGVKSIHFIDPTSGELVDKIDLPGESQSSAYPDDILFDGRDGIDYQNQWEKKIMEPIRSRRITDNEMINGNNRKALYYFNTETGSAMVIVEVVGFTKDQIEVTSTKQSDGNFHIVVDAKKESTIPAGFKKIGGIVERPNTVHFECTYQSDVESVELINGELRILTKPLSVAAQPKPKKIAIK
ncbi:hypothetical protein phiOC_p006 [Ochrobactrum phage vB_OspM_OC]|nr:hypothetical protein phiOC_p006 [Ochrobactrum phage vB_OspM_OC]